MKITVKAINTDGKAYAEINTSTLKHPTMMMIRKLVWQVCSCNEDLVRIDTSCYFGDTHIEIRHDKNWTVTYVEDEFFCDTAIEFDTKGELIQFIKDILTNLEEADKAEEEWEKW